MPLGWSQIASSIAANSYDYTAPATTSPSVALYHVIAMASGNTESAPSAFDYATTATTLFAEAILGNGGTTIRGAPVQELRTAIDALRSFTNVLPAAWTDYNATGPVMASDQTAMRTALDQAVTAIMGQGHAIAYTPPVPATTVIAWAYHMTQLRAGVK